MRKLKYNTDNISNNFCKFFEYESLRQLLVIHYLLPPIVKMQNICSMIGWNSVHISDIFNCYCANINGLWNARKLGGIYKTFEFILT